MDANIEENKETSADKESERKNTAKKSKVGQRTKALIFAVFKKVNFLNDFWSYTWRIHSVRFN